MFRDDTLSGRHGFELDFSGAFMYCDRTHDCSWPLPPLCTERQARQVQPCLRQPPRTHLTPFDRSVCWHACSHSPVVVSGNPAGSEQTWPLMPQSSGNPQRAA